MTVNLKNSLAQIPWKPHFPFLLAAKMFAQKAVLPPCFLPLYGCTPSLVFVIRIPRAEKKAHLPRGEMAVPPGEPVFKKEGTKVLGALQLDACSLQGVKEEVGTAEAKPGESQDALSSYLASKWLTLVIERLLAGCWSHHPHLPNRAIARAVTSPWPFLMKTVWLEPARMCLWGTRPYSSPVSTFH